MAHLSSVRLRGFKSFARPTELVLQPGITVVIGPNGSGKSNLADAVLWVLGEQSAGALRGRNMQDVIFTGPEGRKSSAVAEVSLTFDNGGGTLPLNCNEVEITRRLVRDSGSEYRLNGSPCRLLDVQDLMGSLGLGREMHSVISQGKVEALLNSTPEARRALVEEAAGLGRFKKRRERARAKLDRTRQNLIRVSDVEREVKNSLRPMRQQAASAERFALAMEEWALAQARLLVLDLLDIQSSRRRADVSMEQLARRRSEIEGKLDTLRLQREDEEQYFAAALRSRETLAAAFHRVRAEAERLRGRAVALRQRVARNEGELERSGRRRELAENELASVNAWLQRMGATTADEERLAWVSGVAARLRAELDRLVPGYREALQQEDELKDAVFELEASRSRALQDRDYLRREAEDKGRLGLEIRELIRTAEEKVERLRREVADREEKLARVEGSVSHAIESLNEAVRRREDAQLREREASQDQARVTELLTGLEMRREVLHDVVLRREGASPGAHELMRELQGCRLLAEVLSVKPGYETGLSAALGPIVQAVVLDASVDAAAALSTPGPLEVVWEAQEREQPAGGGGTPRCSEPPAGTTDLWDLVSGPEPVIRTLKALVPPTAVLGPGEKLVAYPAEGLEWEGWQVVSANGEVIRPGLHAARRTDIGAEALLLARNELAALSAEEVGLSDRLESARRTAEDARLLSAESESARHRLEREAREAQSGFLAAKGEAELHVRRLEEAETQAEELRERLQRELQVAAQLDTDLGGAEELAVSMGARLEEARTELHEIQGRVESLRVDVAGLEEKKGQAALLEVRLKERNRALESERQRASSQREAAARDVERFSRRMDLAGSLRPILERLREVVEELAGMSGRIAADLEARVEEARAQSESAARVMRDWGGAEAQLQRDLEEITNARAQIQVEQAHMEDRETLLDAELGELRRKHMGPRTVVSGNVSGCDRAELVLAVTRAEQRKERIGPVNPLAEQECAEMEGRARFLAEQRRDLESSIGQLQDIIRGLDEHINGSFDAIFKSIEENFASVIATVFPGAKGSLTLTEARSSRQAAALSEDDPSGDLGEVAEGEEGSPGISLSVKFPNKAPRSMSLLSGGEKAMTAIAFLFSLFLARPCPFYILDEVEASLDDVNIRRFLSLIRRYRERTQFIVITHQRQTMEIADTLYGVALEPDGTSRVLSRRLGEKKAVPSRRGREDRTESLPKEATA